MSLSLRKWTPYVLGIIVGAFIALVLYGIIHSNHQSTSACSAANGIGDGIILVLQDGQRAAQSQPAETIKEKQRRAAVDFYNKAIKHIEDSKCHS